MAKRASRRGVLVGLVATVWISVLGSVAYGIPAPPVPGAIAVPAGNVAFLVGHAQGTQNYQCQAVGGGHAWTLVSPAAVLKDGSREADHLALRGAELAGARREHGAVGVRVASAPALGTQCHPLAPPGPGVGLGAHRHPHPHHLHPAHQHHRRGGAGHRVRRGPRRGQHGRAVHRRLLLLSGPPEGAQPNR